ncbi:cell division FtsA domain-containing protein [Effusibacillus lacus]|uniref:ATPase n=1 Tax=Effusibacillus lacus TaxID=1348429 RepID=A0A292YJ00_9BACL|nr:cell division FtsA domain-containing protein [Effusibacillus lacus]TCS70096.1 cell division protein FtsA [Effusibacillus lacus]GAX91067.1 ATPase [Effusibacillus lacus]
MAGSEDLIFALDIGTRSVVGLVARYGDNGLEIVAAEQMEHANRAMLDGQIHDVVQVAALISKIKDKLEQSVGPLHRVAVAAAGRALKTVRSRVERETNGERLSQDDVLALELSAVQKAERELQSTMPDAARYHCVGYTVMHYMLDDSPIGSLIDQLGLVASVEIIATFLPRIVIDSLQFALQRADLEMAALTLEPIAAINALIPPSMRKLNLVLVDIGAGTSDIAITSEGTVTAYGMVPVAGDEITEALSHKYLLDFPVAEMVKRGLLSNETISFADVLGITHELPSRDVLATINPEVTDLAKRIAEEILSLNGKCPQAVMLVGGGSQTPLLPERLADILGLPKERVVIRGADAIGKLQAQHEQLSGPDAVTPIGIALAAIHTPVSSVSIRVNGQAIRLFEFRQVTIGDALLAADIDIRKLHGRPGMALTVEVHGLVKTLKGTMGTPATLLLNKQPAHLGDVIQHGDEIEIIEGQPGEDAQGTVADVLPDCKPFSIFVNGQERYVHPVIRMNGELASLATPLVDRAQITMHIPEALIDILPAMGYTPEIFRDHTVMATVNGEARSIRQEGAKVLVNGNPVPLHAAIKSGDRIDVVTEDRMAPTVRDFLKEEEWERHSLQVMVNGNRVQLFGPVPALELNGEPVAVDSPVPEFASITVKREPWMPVFSQIFNYVHIDRERPSNAINLRMEHNGEKADFSTPLRDGDVIVIEWELRDSSEVG